MGPNSPWNNVLQLLETFFRRLIFLLHTLDDLSSLLQIIITIFKIPVICQYKVSRLINLMGKIKETVIARILKINNRTFNL